MYVYQTLINVGKTMSCLPPMTGNGMNGKLLAPIKMVKLGMVYYCFTNIAMILTCVFGNVWGTKQKIRKVPTEWPIKLA